MALGPIELNVTVTRVQDYTTIKHNEDIRPNVQQMDLSQSNIKEANHKASFVEKKDESKAERNARYERWMINHKRIDEWRRLYQSLSDAERNEFISIIGNNDFMKGDFCVLLHEDGGIYKCLT